MDNIRAELVVDCDLRGEAVLFEDVAGERRLEFTHFDEDVAAGREPLGCVGNDPSQ